jgi:hypothetical protein
LGVFRLLTSAPMWAGMFLVRGFPAGGEVANYGRAVLAATVYMTIAWLGNRVLAPHIVGPYGPRREFVFKLLGFLGTFHATLLTLGLAGSAAVIWWLLPPDYHSAIVPTALALCTAMVVSLGQPVAVYLLRAKCDTALLVIALAAGGLFLIAAGAAVPAFGSTGVWCSALFAAGVGLALRMRVAVAANSSPDRLSDAATGT